MGNDSESIIQLDVLLVRSKVAACQDKGGALKQMFLIQTSNKELRSVQCSACH